MQKVTVVILVFCFSLCIRIPFLGQKLEGFGHQEWLAGHTLVILKIWHKEGIAKHHYALPYTFYRSADKHIPFIPGVQDKQGNGYYISYPPLAFYVLYATTSTLSVIPNEVFLQVMTLLIQLITGILLYVLLKKCGFSDKHGLVGASAYFLLPVTLRYHTQAYFCDILAQIGIVTTLITYQNYLGKKMLKNAVLIGLTLFLLTFTEWIGIFLCFTFLLHQLWLQKNLKYITYYLFWVFCVGLSIGLTLWIYSHIAGWQTLSEAILHKAKQRTVSDEVVYFSRWDWNTYWTVIRYYVVHYFPALLSITICILTIARKNMVDTKIPSLFIISFVAIFLHHFMFLNFTAENDFSILKTAIPILMLWVYLIAVSKYPKYMLNMSYLILVFSALYVTYKGAIKPKTNHIQRFASELVRLSPENEMLVLHSSSSISPQVMYYAERNVYMNISKNEVKTHLQKHNLNKAIILYTDWQYQIQKIDTVYAK